MSFVDFHCHLDLYPDLEKAIWDAEAAQVYTLAVTTTPRAWPRNQQLSGGMKFVRAALGLHPQLVQEFPRDINVWDQYLEQAKFVGEVGLDAGPRYYKSLGAQEEAFVHVLQRCAASRPKVLSIHSVRSAKLVLDNLERHLPLTHHSAVLHWFTGSASEARRAVELGCYFSVNSAMLSGNRGCALVRELPPGRILTETDGPFTQRAGRSACPADVEVTVEELASVLGRGPREMAASIAETLRALLGPRAEEPANTKAQMLL